MFVYVSGVVGYGPRSELSQLSEQLEENHRTAVARPMPGTLPTLPWAAQGKHRIGEVLCETF